MSTNFGNFCDDFFVNMHLHTALPMPEARETILGFCEAVQKEFPDLSTFYRRDDGTYVLEGDRTAGSYRCVEIAQRELSSGAFNPDSVDAACRQHAWVLERSRYFLGISHLDVESLDLVLASSSSSPATATPSSAMPCSRAANWAGSSASARPSARATPCR